MDAPFEHTQSNELSPDIQQQLRDITDGIYDGALEKVKRDFDWDEFKTNETFKAALMPEKLFWVIANYERSFTQRLGQHVYEQFAVVIATENESLGNAETQHKIKNAQSTPHQEQTIEQIITDLEAGDRSPDWHKQRTEVEDAGNIGDTEPQGKLNWDVWIEDFKNGRPLAAELKSPKPNKDQTIAALRKMLRTVAAYSHRNDPQPVVRYVFPFNPFGSLENYSHWPPKQYFNVEKSDGMMVADGFWDVIGGEGTMNGVTNFLLEESHSNFEELVKLGLEEDDSFLDEFVSD